MHNIKVATFQGASYIHSYDDKNNDIFSDYMETEIWVLYLAIGFHTVLWGVMLKVYKVYKEHHLDLYDFAQ